VYVEQGYIEKPEPQLAGDSAPDDHLLRKKNQSIDPTRTATKKREAKKSPITCTSAPYQEKAPAAL
jgi:hypothetical protein